MLANVICQQDFHLYIFFGDVLYQSSLCHFSVLKRNEATGLPLVFVVLWIRGKMDSELCILSFPNQFQNVGCSLEVIVFITHSHNACCFKQGEVKKTQCCYREEDIIAIANAHNFLLCLKMLLEREQWEFPMFIGKTFIGCLQLKFEILKGSESELWENLQLTLWILEFWKKISS